ncbi:hypothetical protein BX661DRAFT_177242 [Kickxella alabastrina]|uniref:uncharacterized protein n=1 Tax=Kickxella alabastrina TaxID=61397 RepID=UPI00221FBFD5|nr:uncharacterized protein BX661DRAFT_177242 [Kickxella alabastrina]KAI7833622.1 hypothetical protein BX661DRAFT_177242 [Kickxella alabastrina]
MKFLFVAAILAVAASAIAAPAAMPEANPSHQLNVRASIKYNIAAIRQAISYDNSAASSLKAAISKTNKAYSNLSSSSGSAITAARNAHIKAIQAQKAALAATNAVANALKKLI